jgi:glycosyltransferase involved in cell wall biosynthesis
LACGTPVIAFDKGAAPEIIKNNETGFIVKNLNEMKRAILNIGKIERINCRKETENRFSLDRMTREYENLYYKIIKKYA